MTPIVHGIAPQAHLVSPEVVSNGAFCCPPDKLRAQHRAWRPSRLFSRSGIQDPLLHACWPAETSLPATTARSVRDWRNFGRHEYGASEATLRKAGETLVRTAEAQEDAGAL